MPRSILRFPAECTAGDHVAFRRLRLRLHAALGYNPPVALVRAEHPTWGEHEDLRSRPHLSVRRALGLGRRLPPHQRRHREGLHPHLRDEPGHPRGGGAAPDRARPDLHDARRPHGRPATRSRSSRRRSSRRRSEGGFFSYAAGVAYQVLTHYRVRGLVIDNTRTDLPIKKGLSSSAAISVLTARAFNRVYDLKLTVRGEMELAYQGEITTPSRCGRMDQGCAYGDRAVLMDVRRRPPQHRGGAAGEGPALRDRRPQGGQEHAGDPQAAEPLLPRSPKGRSSAACRSCSGRSTSGSWARPGRRSRRATPSGSAR